MTSLPQAVPWAIALIALLVLAAVVLWKGTKRTAANGPLPTDWNVAARPLFRPDERRAYRKLREALPHHVILSKLPLVRFCHPDDPGQVRYWYELLGSIYVSFCICSSGGRVLAVIDVEASRPDPQRTKRIKQAVLAACGIPYLRCALAQFPSPAELQVLVPPVSSTRRSADDAEARESSGERRWHDSALFDDSFFGNDSRQDGESTGDFVSLRGVDPRQLAGAPKAAADEPGDAFPKAADTVPAADTMPAADESTAEPGSPAPPARR